MRKLILAASLFLALPAFAGELPIRPDPKMTPGALNPEVTQETIHQTICVPGWTATVRPPVSYTNKLKREQLAEYGYTDKDLSHYEEDHAYPIELGGHPTDPRNLWPEARAGEWGARVKDVLETYLKREVCAGRMTLEEARAAIMPDWIAAYQRYVGSAPVAQAR